MRAEFYVKQVIRWNASLRPAVGRVIGVTVSQDDEPAVLLYELEDLATIAQRLHCDPKDVFERIRQSIAVDAGGRRTGAVTGQPDLDSLFRNQKLLSVLAADLHCAATPPDVLRELFDIDELRSVLTAAGLNLPRDASIEDLFLLAVGPFGSRKLRSFLGGADLLATIVFLMRPTAGERLSAAHGGAPHEVLMRLASAQERAEIAEPEPTGQDGTHALDYFGVERMREQLRAIANAYMHQAREAADDAATSSRIGRSMVALLDLGANAFRSALLKFVEDRQSVASLCTRVISAAPNGAEGDHTLRATAEADTVLVEMRGPAKSDWLMLARLQAKSAEAATHLAERLPRDTAEIGGLGRHWIDRLLDFAVPAPPRPSRNSWRRLVEQGIPLIDAFILSGRVLPDPFGIVKVFRRHIAVDGAERSVRTWSPTPADMQTDAVATYELVGKRLKIV